MARSLRSRITAILVLPTLFATFSILAEDEPSMATTHAVCRRASAPPVLDGKLDDPCWKQAAVIDKFASFWSKTRREGTRAHLTWDDEALYFSGIMTDAEVRAAGQKRNDSLWDGDVFELFLKPSADRPEYFEFQGNPRGLVFELAFPERGTYPKDLHAAPALGTAVAVAVDGTLDHPGDTDRSWTIEGRIPWTAFALAGGRPKAGDTWKFAICRYDYGPEGTEPVLMSSAPLTERNFHRHEDFGSLTFEGPPAAAR